MRAVIMAGGEGTRLRPLTGEIPKPLVQLCGRPVIDYILDLLSGHDCDEAVITLRYRGEMIANYLSEGAGSEENAVYQCPKRPDKPIKLRFSYEDEPLGTAGSVKKAFRMLCADALESKKIKEPVLVISGDALCDFNLSKALDAHMESAAEATIITKQVADPREYGLVITDDDHIPQTKDKLDSPECHRVTGFSEKPSYLGCVSDSANTGIYIIEPSVMELIADDTPVDFARDVFPKMLEAGNRRLMAYPESGYWCDVGDFPAYLQAQQDILTGQVKCGFRARRIAVGVFSDSPIPERALIIPPCYIGGNVRIGENAIIEGGVISDNVQIGRGARIYNSVILSGAALSPEVSLSESVVCPNARLKTGSSMGEGSVLGANSVVGERAVIFAGVKVWDNKDVPAMTAVRGNLRHGGRQHLEIDDNGFYGETNVDITPELAARMGCALSRLDSDNIIISCEKNTAAIAIKNALIAGLSSAGTVCSDCGFAALPVLIHFSRLVNSDLLIYVSAHDNTKINILGYAGLPLSRSQERSLENAFARSEYRAASWEDFGEVRSIKSAEELYDAYLRKNAGFKSRYDIAVTCQNSRLQNICSHIFRTVSNKAGEDLTIAINPSGTKAEFRLENRLINHDRLTLLAVANQMKGGLDAALPADFPAAAEFLAENHGRKILRFFSCPNDSSDSAARELAKNEAFLLDGAYLAIYVLSAVTADGISLAEADGALPVFSRENRMIAITCPPQRILERISTAGGKSAGEGVLLTGTDGRVLLRSNKHGSALFMFAESMSSETAKSLCDDVEKTVRKLMENDNNS